MSSVTYFPAPMPSIRRSITYHDAPLRPAIPAGCTCSRLLSRLFTAPSVHWDWHLEGGSSRNEGKDVTPGTDGLENSANES